jgi:hypothetical protein
MRALPETAAFFREARTVLGSRRRHDRALRVVESSDAWGQLGSVEATEKY